ncbi:hypothetical protein VPH35_108170 [Triticum aestivum]
MSLGGDPFASLTDQLVSYVLSFLPSREAVQTSCLSRRWRHLWRSTPAVRVCGSDEPFLLLVKNLLIHRNNASAPPLRLFEIDADLKQRVVCSFCRRKDRHSKPDRNSRPWEVHPDVDFWVSQALSRCRARSLTACFSRQEGVPWKPRCPLPFASVHLTKIHLDTVCLVNGQLDFSCCPALLRLTLVGCWLHGDALVSPSLERLAIVECRRTDEESDDTLHVSLSTPKLRFLEISHNYCKEQFLKMMSWLTEDSVSYTDVDTMLNGR